MEYSKATNWNGSPGSSTASLDSTGATSGAPHFEIGMSCFNQRVNGGFVIVYKPTFTSLKGPHPVVSHSVSQVFRDDTFAPDPVRPSGFPRPVCAAFA
jgi:hypothetical protein